MIPARLTKSGGARRRVACRRTKRARYPLLRCVCSAGRIPRSGGARLTRMLAAAPLLLTLGCDPTPRLMATYMGTPAPVVRAMLELAKVGPGDVVYDLGSGDGRIVIAAARDFGARGIGIDIDPKLVALARENARKVGVADKVQFIEADIFQADISGATVVTLYLYHTVNLRLRPKLLADLRPGTRVVSHEWSMGNWKPEAQRAIEDTHIYLWRIPARTDKPAAQ